MKRLLLSLAVGVSLLSFAAPARADHDDDYRDYIKKLQKQQKREAEYLRDQQKRYEKFVRDQAKREAEFQRDQQKRYERLLKDQKKWQREYYENYSRHRHHGHGGFDPGFGSFPPAAPYPLPGHFPPLPAYPNPGS